jgi:CRISPR-associated endonuclease Csn1
MQIYFFFNSKNFFIFLYIQIINIMSKILGLDLGTNSIGWAIIEKDQTQYSVLNKGVRIFSEGVKSEKGIESSKAAERTAFRSARKIKFRRKLRKYETLLALAKNKMCPLRLEEVIDWRKSNFKHYPLNPEFLKWLQTDDKIGINPYYLRDKASKQTASLQELGRALYHIAQRRGFLSNRLDQSAEGIIEFHAPNIENIIEEADSLTELKVELKNYFITLDILEKSAKDTDEGEKKLKSLYNALDKITNANASSLDSAKTQIIDRLNKIENLGEVKKDISDISKAITEGGFKTLGQYFNSLYNNGKIRNKHTAREEHYLNEFEYLLEKQNISGINKTENLPEKRYTGLAKELYRAIFFQRPLKSQKGLIAKCSFEKSKSRCAISHPAFEEYRMWTYINTIKIKTPSDDVLRFLTSDEKNKIIPKFLRKKDNFNFEDLAIELIPKGKTFSFSKSSNAKNAEYIFNYKHKDTVSGSPVSASFKNIFGDNWNTIIFSYQTKNKENKDINHSINYLDLWHLLYVSTSNSYLYDFALNKLKLDEKKANSFSKIRLKKDFGNLSLNAINKITPFLKQGLKYSHAVFMANLLKIVDKNIWSKPLEQEKIKAAIAQIIDNHSIENDKLEIVNSIIKNAKANGEYYSLEAEKFYFEDITKKTKSFFNYYAIQDSTIQEQINQELFKLVITQLKKYEFLSIKRIDEKVKEFLLGNNSDGEVFCNNQEKLNLLYHPSDMEVFKRKIIKDENGNEQVVLGSPLVSSIKNPMAMRALHQMRKVLNQLILRGEIDTKTKVHIELARELNDANKRKAIQDFQNENKKKREDYKKEIKKLYFEECKQEIEPTEDDLLRYQLWIEQGKKEIYEEGKNISIADIIGSNPKYDIEHTIPRSISQDNSLMNKTLCSIHFNRQIKKNKMPIELSNHNDILLRVNHWKVEAEKIQNEIDSITKSIKAAATKDAKDRKIRKRHFLTMQKEYFQGKYYRFEQKEAKTGFKNSQIPDTGIITKYSRAFLASYFNRVESVKGGMVAEFRKIWGLQERKTYFNDSENTAKSRDKHTHHTVDAITIACMTKEKYDILASAWNLEEGEQLTEARKILAASKPWPTFTEDLKKWEDEILVSHYTPDNVKKQSKKVVRIRGKKQYLAETEKDSNGKFIAKKDTSGKVIYKLNEKGQKIPRIKTGDTIRGSLHLDSIYGAIKKPSDQDGPLQYVIRKDLYSIKESDINNIVDQEVKQKIQKAKEDKVLVFSSNAQQKNKIEGTVWMNQEKQIPINKVRIYANSVKNPLHIKKHQPLSISRHPHKQMVYGQNESNYAMALYEGIDKSNKIKRSCTLVNLFDAAQYFKHSNQAKEIYPLVPEKDENQLPLKYILTKGIMVLMYDKSPEELFEMPLEKLVERLYEITQLDIEASGIKLLHHTEAREKKVITESMGLKVGMKGGKNLGEYKKFPWLKIAPNAFDCLVEGYDFNFSADGKIKFK